MAELLAADVFDCDLHDALFRPGPALCPGRTAPSAPYHRPTVAAPADGSASIGAKADSIAGQTQRWIRRCVFMFPPVFCRPHGGPGRLRRTELQKLPVVLDADEGVRFLEAVPSLKSRAAMTAA